MRYPAALQIDVLDLPAGVTSLELSPSPRPTLDNALIEHWCEMCRANPRLHDGDILAVDSLNAQRGHLRLRRDTFARLAVQHHELVRDLGVRLLGVKAILIAQDAAGREYVYLQRRHANTRIYGQQWEIGPGGGVSPRSPHSPHADDLWRSTVTEVHEEAAIDLASQSPVPTPGFVLMDDEAKSCDICFVIHLPTSITPTTAMTEATTAERPSWESTHAHWLARDEASAFDRAHAASISPPMRAIMRRLGWVAAIDH